MIILYAYHFANKHSSAEKHNVISYKQTLYYFLSFNIKMIKYQNEILFEPFDAEIIIKYLEKTLCFLITQELTHTIIYWRGEGLFSRLSVTLLISQLIQYEK